MTVEELNIVVTAQNAQFNARMDEVNNQLDRMGSTAEQSASSALSAFKSMAAGIAALGIGNFFKNAITAAGEMEQNIGGSEAVFKDYADTVQQSAKQAYSALGLAESEYLASANKMGALFQGAGFSIGKSAEMTTQAMQRASDVASIMGISVTDAMTAVSGAAKGNFTMMDNLGVAINDTTLQIYAQEKGLGKLETTQQKVSAAMQMFIDKTEYAAGNYAKENDTYAGSLTTLKAEVDNFMADVGKSFLPLAQSVIPMLSQTLDKVTPVVKGVADGVAGIGTAIMQISAPTWTFIKIALISAAAIKGVAIATQLMTMAQAANKAMLTLLIPKTFTWGNALRAVAGWIGIIAGVLALVSMIGSEDTSGTATLNEDLDSTSSGADKAADSVDGLNESVGDLDKTTRKLAGIDKLNVLGSGGSSIASSIVNTDDISNIEDFQSELSDVMKTADKLSDTEISFGFDFDTVAKGFERIYKYIAEDLFGENFQKFWMGVGGDIRKMVSGTPEERYETLMKWTKSLEEWLNNSFLSDFMPKFGTAWVNGWMSVGDLIFNYFRDSFNPDEFQKRALDEKYSDDYAESYKAYAQTIIDINSEIAKGEDKLSAISKAYRNNFYDENGNMTTTLDKRNEYAEQIASEYGLNKMDVMSATDYVKFGNKFILKKDMEQILASSGSYSMGPDYVVTPTGPFQLDTSKYPVSASSSDLKNNGNSSFYNDAYAAPSDQKIEQRIVIELDGDVVGEKVQEYNWREYIKGNGGG